MNTRKALCFLLALVMVLSIALPTTIFAENENNENVENTENVENVENTPDENSEPPAEQLEQAEKNEEAEPEQSEPSRGGEMLRDGPKAAVITTQPQNAAGKVGDVVTFSVAADNAVSYQWQFSKDGGAHFKNTGITGNKTDTITVTLTSTYITYYWRCIVTGEDGVGVQSDPATTIVPAGAVITKQPENANGKVGDVVTFSVEATDAVSYQWQFSADGGVSFKNTGITGNKTNTITVTLTSTYITYYWRCIVTGEDGIGIQSDPATTIAPAGAVITKQPENANGKVGDVVTFSVEATDAVSYQWQFSADGGANFKNTGITGNKTDTITVTLTSTYITYYWRCIVTGEDGVGVQSDPATTIAPAGAVITKQPENANGKVGDVVTFSVEATDAVSYQWQFSKDGGVNFKNTGITGNKTNTITVTLTSTYITYYWRCIVTGADGIGIQSDPATTIVPAGAVITKQPENASGKVGDTVSFSVEATDAVSYQWQFSKDGGVNFKNTGITGNKTDTITVTLTSAYITYYWRCIVTGADGVGMESDPATTIVPKSAVITKDPEDVLGKIGEKVNFSVEATDAVSYQWQFSKDGVNFKNTGITGNKTDTITVTLTSAYITYYWRCIVTGEDGVGIESDPATTQTQVVQDDVAYEYLSATTCRVVSYTGDAADLVVPEEIKAYSLTMTVIEIGESAFESKTSLVSIDLPDTIKVIGKRAFAGCTSLRSMS